MQHPARQVQPLQQVRERERLGFPVAALSLAALVKAVQP